MSTNNSAANENTSIVYPAKFAILMSLEIPSILMSLVIFMHLATNSDVRSTDHQYSIFTLLAINFIQVLFDIPMSLSFYHFDGQVRPFTFTYCTWWIWFEFTLNIINIFLMAWISIERHLLIFHSYNIRNMNRWKRKLVQKLPLMISIIWPILFHIVAVVISPICTNTFASSRLFCGQPCFLMTNWAIFDILFNIVFPVAIILFANIILMIRILCQQLYFVNRRQIHWRNQRKMVLQLGSIAVIYLGVWTPVSVAELGIVLIDSTFLLSHLDTIFFCIYFVPLMLPIVCFPSIPKLKQRLKSIWQHRQHNTVEPHTTTRGQTYQLKKTDPIFSIRKI